MAFTHSLKTVNTYTVNGVTAVTLIDTDSQTAGEELNLSESFTDATDALVAFTLDVSQCKAFAIWSVGGNMTVETNSSSSPVDTFALVDGVAVLWSVAQPNTPDNPVTTDITALYVTNTGTAVLHVRSLSDPTV